MQEELRQLISLQNLDSQIRTLAQAQAELPKGLEEFQARLAAAQTALDEEEQHLAELQKQHRHLESEMVMLDEGIRRSRQRLMEIKDNIEYKAMLREIAFREDRKDEKETEILKLLEEIESRSTALAQRQEEVAALEREFQHRQAEVEAQLAEMSQQMQELQDERPHLRQAISPALLKRYEFIRERRNGTAIAEVRQGVCQACHMNLPPQHFIELQKEQEVLSCPYCQRIIYWAGPAASEEESPKAAAR